MSGWAAGRPRPPAAQLAKHDWWHGLVLLAWKGQRLGLALLLAGWPGAAQAGGVDCALVFAQEPAAASQGGVSAGSRIAVLHPDGRPMVLTEGFAAAVEPCVSFDGRNLLFAGRLRAADPWDIWEMSVDGSRKRRVTSGLGDCREPVYLARAAVDAPNFKDKVRWISFVSTAPGVFDELGRGPLTSVYAMSLTPVPGRGTVLWRTTYNLGGDLAPTVLADGRVLFSAWQRQGYALMTISWAGEDINPFYGSHDGAVSQLSACELREDRRVVFIEREGEAEGRGGRLAQVWLRRPLRSHQVLSRDSGMYRTPCGVPGGGLLVARTDSGGTYGLYLFDIEKGGPGRLVFDAPDWHDVDPQPLVVRSEPTGRIPMAEFASVLDLGGFGNAGQLQCMSVYDSDREEAAAITPGQVKAVRLIEGLAVSAADSALLRRDSRPRAADAWPPPFVTTRPLGEAPVEADGSFYVNVAGDVPFYIETLDEQGRVSMTMRAWTWVRNGDQRGCIGCHENKELAPENRATEALVKGKATWLLGPRSREASGPP